MLLWKDCLDQVLFFFLRPFQESLRLHRFKLHRYEIWQDCTSSKYVSIDRVGFSIWHQTFM